MHTHSFLSLLTISISLEKRPLPQSLTKTGKTLNLACWLCFITRQYVRGGPKDFCIHPVSYIFLCSQFSLRQCFLQLSEEVRN